MKCLGAVCLLLHIRGFHGRSWWCETSSRTGCRGTPRQFIRLAPHGHVPPLGDVATEVTDEPIVVDWNNDGQLDVILTNLLGTRLWELKSGIYVEAEPNPFEGIRAGECRPAVVDWNGDGFLDLLVGTEDGIKHYERRGGKLEDITGQSPFQGLGVGHGCSNPAIADLDGDGDSDLMIGRVSEYLSYFEQTSDGRFVARSSPVGDIDLDRPMLADWDGDGRMDVMFLEEFNRRVPRMFAASLAQSETCCPVHIFLQKAAGNFTRVDSLHGPSTPGFGCRNFGCMGFSLVDLDNDGDLDAVFGQPFSGHMLKHFEHRLRPDQPLDYLAEPSETQSDSVHIDMLRLPYKRVGAVVTVSPVLADWDLDGDLDLALFLDVGAKNAKRDPVSSGALKCTFVVALKLVDSGWTGHTQSNPASLSTKPTTRSPSYGGRLCRTVLALSTSVFVSACLMWTAMARQTWSALVKPFLGCGGRWPVSKIFLSLSQ